MKRTSILALLLLLATTSISAQAPAVTAADTFTKLRAKGSPPVQDLLYLHMADRLLGTKAIPATETTAQEGVTAANVNSRFVAAANAQRTDMQLGAASSAPGSTSLIDKPGAADLLALALERGAVNKSSSGTAFTLSTTPYMLAGFIGPRDTPDNWEKYASLRHIALSATFANEDTVLKDGDFSSVQSGEVKWTILGNRSPRDTALLSKFKQVASAPVLDKDSFKSTVCLPIANLVGLARIGQASAKIAAPAGDATLRSDLDTIISGITLTDQQREELDVCAKAIIAAEDTANAAAAKLKVMTDEYVALNQKKQLSLSVSSHRDTTIDDYATVKLLYAYDTAPKVTINLNGQGDFNQHYQHKDLHRVRAYSVELGATLGRFAGSRFDTTLSSKAWRNNDTDNRNVTVVQAKGNIYLTDAFVLPVSISFANKVVGPIKKGWQINVGVASLFDSFLARRLDATP